MGGAKKNDVEKKREIQQSVLDSDRTVQMVITTKRSLNAYIQKGETRKKILERRKGQTKVKKESAKKEENGNHGGGTPLPSWRCFSMAMHCARRRTTT